MCMCALIADVAAGKDATGRRRGGDRARRESVKTHRRGSPGDSSTETDMPGSPAARGSKLWNCDSRSDGGIKWPFRALSRERMRSNVPCIVERRVDGDEGKEKRVSARNVRVRAHTSTHTHTWTHTHTHARTRVDGAKGISKANRGRSDN